MRKRRKGSTNKELLTWKWDLLTLGFGHEWRNVKECKLCLSNLADKLSRENGESYASAISWLGTRTSFEILRSLHTCVPGSRTPFKRTHADFLNVLVLVF